MKIGSIETFPITEGHRNYLFVTVETDTGIVGIGEAALMGRELAVMGALEHLTPLLIGQDVSRLEHLWQVLFRGGFFSRWPRAERGDFRDRRRVVGHSRQAARRSHL
jgi:L-alanine-DL-glutamate epimerase-like enolase superfamily enzyme